MRPESTITGSSLELGFHHWPCFSPMLSNCPTLSHSTLSTCHVFEWKSRDGDLLLARVKVAFSVSQIHGSTSEGAFGCGSHLDTSHSPDRNDSRPGKGLRCSVMGELGPPGTWEWME